jgi:hypothetical protein
MTLIRGVLLAGRFRTHPELNRMSDGDQRNTLIVELSNRSRQSNYPSFDDVTLAGFGAVLVFLREAKIRDDVALKTMTADDQRNTLIVELKIQMGMSVRELQSMSNMALVLLGLGNVWPGSLTLATFLRGVLLAGRFRTQHELNTMSADDQRNTLIVELTAHSNQSDYQSYDDYTLAGMGAVLVLLREGKVRDDGALRTMSADDQRNTLIVEIEALTKLGVGRLQGLINMDLVLAGLGVPPVFRAIRPPLQPVPPLPCVFSVNSVEVQEQKTDNAHSDSDWLSIIVTVANLETKSSQTWPARVHPLGGRMKTGDVINGSFESGPIDAGRADVVIVNYFITNLGSSRAEDQFKEAVQVTDKVVGVVAPIVGTVIGTFLGNPKAGLEIGQAVAKGFDAIIDGLSDAFDFLGIHVGPANCNGEVLHDTLTYQPAELEAAIGQGPASREYTGPQENRRCGSPPRSKVTFQMFRPATPGA